MDERQRLRIAVADDEPEMREFLRRALFRIGHYVLATAEDGQQLVELSRQCRPDLIITDLVMPVLDGLGALEQLCQDQPVPAILVSAYYDEAIWHRAQETTVMAYLIKPIKQADLAPAIRIAQKRFQQLQALQREAASLRQALKDRKLIERAKGVFMSWCGCDEPTAFRQLQKLASAHNKKLVEIAEAILIAEKARGNCAGTPADFLTIAHNVRNSSVPLSSFLEEPPDTLLKSRDGQTGTNDQREGNCGSNQHEQ